MAAAVPLLAQTSGLVFDADYYFNDPFFRVSRGQVVTFYVHGVGASLTQPVAAPSLPLPTELAGISVRLNPGTPIDRLVPLFRVDPVPACETDAPFFQCGSVAAITLQIPLEFRGGADFLGEYLAFYEGGELQSEILLVSFPQAHIVRTGDSVASVLAHPPPCDPDHPIISHADGSSVTLDNPAQLGEILTLLAVGTEFGPDTALLQTGAPAPDNITIGVGLALDFGANLPPLYPDYRGDIRDPLPVGLVHAGMVPGQVGIHRIDFQIPAEAPPGTPICGGVVVSNLTVNIGFGNRAAVNGGSTPGASDGAGICVAVAAQTKAVSQ